MSRRGGIFARKVDDPLAMGSEAGVEGEAGENRLEVTAKGETHSGPGE